MRILPLLVSALALAPTLAACGTTRPATGTAEPATLPFAALGVRKTLDTTIDAAAAHAHAAWLSDIRWRGRDSASEGDNEATRYAESMLRGLGIATLRQPFKNYSIRGQAENLVGLLPGADPTRYVVFGAHKDHIGQAFNGALYPGANDDAGGCAGVLEIARTLANQRNQGVLPPVSVLFILFSGEEKGLIGSRYYTQNPVAPGADGKPVKLDLKQFRGMVQLDVIANGKPADFSTDTAGGDDAAIRQQVIDTARRMAMRPIFRTFVEHIPHNHDVNDELPPGASSDHASLRRAGVRAVLFYAEPIHKYLHHPADTVRERDTFQKAETEVFNDAKLARLTRLGLEQALEWSRNL
ncbi:MAG: M28 family peptidase [Candidatus Sericytochromatia bacterium]|nr:M28 family peptidase [Candidatus Tanganyikabacteria bacterium]